MLHTVCMIRVFSALFHFQCPMFPMVKLFPFTDESATEPVIQLRILKFPQNLDVQYLITDAFFFLILDASTAGVVTEAWHLPQLTSLSGSIVKQIGLIEYLGSEGFNC